MWPEFRRHDPCDVGVQSPWVDWLVEQEEDLFARLAAQRGRRVLKTHTPLDGVALDRRATYAVVVRDPLDTAVSLYHQEANLDRDRIAELSGQPARPASPRPPLPEWLLRWTLRDADPMESLDSLPGVVHHAADAWARRGVLKDPAAFFRRGRPGAGREVLGDEAVAAYHRRVRKLVADEGVDDAEGVLRLLNVDRP